MRVTWESYDQYLNSPEWAKIRQAVFERDFYTCQHCYGIAEVVHHLTYVRQYHELLEDLISLCRDCHWDCHKGDKRNVVADLQSAYEYHQRRIA